MNKLHEVVYQYFIKVFGLI